MSRTDAEWTAWARKNRASFEVAPLVELRGKERMQIGFALTLYVELPMETAPGKERQEAVRRLQEEMSALVKAAIPPGEGVARAELEPPRTAAMLRPENDLRPEVALTWRIFHSDEYMKPVTTAERQGLGQFEKKLTGLGLKHGHW
jgi:hypothetical protein